MKFYMVFISLLAFCLSPDTARVEIAQSVDDGRYIQKDRPDEFILIKGSKIIFRIRLIGWENREVLLENEEYDLALNPDGRLSIYSLRSASPILHYVWLWDDKKKRIIQNEKLLTKDLETYGFVTINIWSKQE